MLWLFLGSGEAPPPGGEALVAGDLTTAFDAWLDSKRFVSPNEGLRAALATEYGVSGGSDATTLLSQFLEERT